MHSINLSLMREKFFQSIDPNNEYSEDDFLKEFGDDSMSNNFNNMKINLNFINKSDNPNPEYATEGSSGFDIRANLDKSILLNSGSRVIVPTGLYFEIPNNFEIQIRPRSGLAAKHGITVLNTPGTIDSDYRGELMIILMNLSDESYVINHGDRIAQAVVATVTAKNIINLNHTTEINKDTERGAGKFGSTGIN